MMGQFALSFHQLVWINAVATVLVLAVIPFVPVVLLKARDSQVAPQ
jgi:hypothetical protein